MVPAADVFPDLSPDLGGLTAAAVYGVVLGFVFVESGLLVGFLLFQHDPTDGFFQPAGIIGSIIGAIVVLAIWVTVSGRRSAARR